MNLKVEQLKQISMSIEIAVQVVEMVAETASN
jgi:hypothetical protein